MSLRSWLASHVFNVTPRAGHQSLPDFVNDSLQDQKQPEYSSDQPIRSKSEDRFNRFPFAERIAEVLAKRTDPSSIVIGIYGPWGDGKTSILHLMENALESHPAIVTIRFNPWYFGNEEKLFRGFFNTLAIAIGKSLPTKAEEVGGLLRDYGSLLSVAGVDLSKVGEAISEVDLEQLRMRLDKLIFKSQKRIVVMIDDIDRLDRREIQTIFKIVKLSAGFDRTSYVLAFDQEVVAASLGESYAQGGIEAGRKFLEKIVQVPLHLPPPDQNALRQLSLTGVQAALNLSGIEFSERAVNSFVYLFSTALEPQIRTPRVAKLYVNAITFALPLLKGEVNAVDHLLIEAIRVLFPNLYELIRTKPAYFLDGVRDSANGAEQKKLVIAAIDAALTADHISETDRIESPLLTTLFPRLKGVFGNYHYGPEWDQTWAVEQHICTGSYFPRYFSYALPPGDVSDVGLSNLLKIISSANDSQSNDAVRKFLAGEPASSFISKLRRQEDKIEPEVARKLGISLAYHGAQFARTRMHLDSVFMQAGILIGALLRRIPSDEERAATAKKIIQTAEPIPFAIEALRWINASDEEKANRAVAPLSEKVEADLAASLVDRIIQRASTSPPYIEFPRDTSMIFWLWKTSGDKAALSSYLVKRLTEHPSEADNLIAAFAGYGWELESGMPLPGRLRRDSYDSIASVISPDFLVENLEVRYGPELQNPQEYPDPSMEPARQLAHQFAQIHKIAVAPPPA